MDDAVYLLNFLYREGEPPPSPSIEPSYDPTVGLYWPEFGCQRPLFVMTILGI